MLKEFHALEANHTWDIVPLPSHKKSIPCKWVYKIKQRSDGSIERYNVPPFFGSQEILLPKLSDALLSKGYIASKNDYSLFTKSSGAFLVILVVYVDDILLAGSDIAEMTALKQLLDDQFKIKNLGLIPRVPHMLAALHVLRYLMSVPTQGILLSNASDLSLVTFSDSDWVTCAFSRRSVTDFFITLDGCPISWKSKKQPTISLSSAEAEYRALRKVVAEVSWLVRLLGDLGLSIAASVPVFCDSQACFTYC
ncbi:secreted RxLR effector protein 161-like [Nicotiana tomentosiformis]|uniref:secreted RxLR effector protein 161-like n=1 Tax=Nicotiana tomentosiformis TaxID=4098 RepID=UPI00388C5733